MSMQDDLNGRYTDRSKPALEDYLAIAERHGLDPAQMALAFVLSRPFTTAVIIGATKMDQLKADIASVDLELSGDVLEDIMAVYKRYPVPM
jgi:aryl-alcohol dehydrogenase-like predicted oxidoreductase